MPRPKLELQTHIRVFMRDKKILEDLMRRYRINSQADAFNKILRRALFRKK